MESKHSFFLQENEFAAIVNISTPNSTVIVHQSWTKMWVKSSAVTDPKMIDPKIDLSDPKDRS